MKLRTFTALLLAAIMLFALTACGSRHADDSSSRSAAGTAGHHHDRKQRIPRRHGVRLRAQQLAGKRSDRHQRPVENVAGAYAEGYDVQIAKHHRRRLGKELVIVKLSWDGLIDALNQGQIDAIIAGMMDTAERRESINFSDPTVRPPTA